MLQSNPALTPNQVKAILQYTAQVYSSYDPLTEGAGFLNAQGAVELARYLAQPSDPYPTSSGWSTRIIWGNRMASGGQLAPDANAWAPDATWGVDNTAGGEPITWGDGFSAHNVVWGSSCGGADCQGPWTIEAADGDDSVVWGTDGDDSVVWGTGDDDSVVWGTGDDDSVVWGTSCSDPSCEPVIWTAP
jgi:hypothetical protein